MNIALVRSSSDELNDLWAHAFKDVRAKRGGKALLTTLTDGQSDADFLASVIAESALWRVSDQDQLKGFVLVRGGVIEAIYVAHGFRRQKVATILVKTLLASDTPPVDAYALPGDRAMKSLYESLGWKARLLTMRGA
jgi:GNAT superfamily N-acetyltransferase